MTSQADKIDEISKSLNTLVTAFEVGNVLQEQSKEKLDDVATKQAKYIEYQKELHVRVKRLESLKKNILKFVSLVVLLSAPAFLAAYFTDLFDKRSVKNTEHDEKFKHSTIDRN